MENEGLDVFICLIPCSNNVDVHHMTTEMNMSVYIVPLKSGADALSCIYKVTSSSADDLSHQTPPSIVIFDYTRTCQKITPLFVTNAA